MKRQFQRTLYGKLPRNRDRLTKEKGNYGKTVYLTPISCFIREQSRNSEPFGLYLQGAVVCIYILENKRN